MRQQQAGTVTEDCQHCADPDNSELRQTKSCMQDEAVEASVRVLHPDDSDRLLTELLSELDFEIHPQRFDLTLSYNPPLMTLTESAPV